MSWASTKPRHIVKVFKYLDVYDLNKASRVCKLWYTAFKSTLQKLAKQVEITSTGKEDNYYVWNISMGIKVNGVSHDMLLMISTNIRDEDIGINNIPALLPRTMRITIDRRIVWELNGGGINGKGSYCLADLQADREFLMNKIAPYMIFNGVRYTKKMDRQHCGNVSHKHTHAEYCQCRPTIYACRHAQRNI